LNWDNTKLDDTTRREIWQAGGLAQLWGARVHVLRKHIGDNEVYGFDTNRMGIMPIRENLKTFDDPVAIREFSVGILAKEEIGFAVVDPRAIVKVALS
jgi:HK97 family phage major capsid protein